MELPLFPLNTALFPGGVLPLRIFETRYLDMVRDCLRNDTPFGVCIALPADEAESGSRRMVGTLGRIVDWDRRPDGLLGITVRGEERFELEQCRLLRNGLLVGQVRVLPWPPETSLPEEFLPLAGFLKRLLDELPPPYRLLQGEFDRAGWVSSRLAELLPLELEQKQALLEMDDHLARLHHLRDIMLGV